MTGAVEITLQPGQKKAGRAVRKLVKAVLAAEGVEGSVSLAFVDESEIRALNARFRELDESTDVLSFRQADSETAWPDPTRESPIELGEVVVCPEVVRRYALEEDGDPETQLGWTVLHGVLHLIGHDHECDSGEMRARESELMRELDTHVRAVSTAIEG